MFYGNFTRRNRAVGVMAMVVGISTIGIALALR